MRCVARPRPGFHFIVPEHTALCVAGEYQHRLDELGKFAVDPGAQVHNHTRMNRRQFLHATGIVSSGVSLSTLTGCRTGGGDRKPWFNISLAEWSLHRALRARKISNLDFPKVARNEFGLRATKQLLETVRTELT